MTDEREIKHEVDIDHLQEIVKSIANGRGEPPETPAPAAPNETDVQRERLRSYVTNITLTALKEIGLLREECGTLISTVQERQDTLLHQIEAFASVARSLMDSKKVMADALADINREFKSLPIAPTLNAAPAEAVPPPVPRGRPRH